MSHTLGHVRLELERPNFRLDLAFEIPSRGVLGIFGPSGSGKTSVLRCIAGLEPEATGHIHIDGETWLDERGSQRPTHRRRIGYVFQESRLFPHLDIRHALQYGIKRADRAQAETDWNSTLELLGIETLLDRHPDQLSGGEKQRVAIARALLSRPRMLLLDEPLASLDRGRKREILPFLERLHEEVSIPILYVSHSVDEIERLCHRLIVLDEGKKTYEGNLLEALTSSDGPFLDRDDAASLISGTVTQYDPNTAISTVEIGAGYVLRLSSEIEPGRVIRLRIRATDVSLSLEKPRPSTILNTLAGQIERCVAEHSHHVTLLISLGGVRVLARISRQSYSELPLDDGSAVFLQVKAVSIHDV